MATIPWTLEYQNNPPTNPTVRIYKKPDGSIYELQGNIDGIDGFERWSCWVVEIELLDNIFPKLKYKWLEDLEGVAEALFNKEVNKPYVLKELEQKVAEEVRWIIDSIKRF